MKVESKRDDMFNGTKINFTEVLYFVFFNFFLESFCFTYCIKKQR